VRIVQVITLFRPDFVGGATLVAERLARALGERGHSVSIFCGRPDPRLPAYGTSSWEHDGIAVTGVHAAAGYDPLAVRNHRHPEVARVFADFLDQSRPDVVHLHSVQALGAELLAVAAERSLPIVLTMHDWWWYCVRLFLVDPMGFVCPPRVDPRRCHCAPDVDLIGRRAFLDAMLAHAARVLAPSRALADAAIANGVPRDRVHVCPNGIEAPRALARRPGPVRFGYVGGPDNRLKGLPCLLAAAAEVDVGGWELELRAVAPGSAAVPAVVADRVRTAPPFAPENLATFLAGIDCLIVPSLMRESYSLVTREALASGLPVIASDSGGPEEVVRPGVNGLVFATGEARDLARCMRQVVLDPDLRARLGVGARSTRLPTIAAQVEQLERIYADVTHIGATAAPWKRRVLFVTGIDGAPFRYRVTNLLDRLATRGIAGEAVYWTDPRALAAIAAADVVVLYRVPMAGYVRDLLAAARRRGVPVLFSCDDLVFEEAAVPADALALLPPGQCAGWLAYVERYAETLRASDGFLGTTEPLVAAASRLGAAGRVVRNGLGEAQLAVAEATRKRRQAASRDGQTIRLAYLSGTTMHDRDFAAIEGALAAVLAARPSVRLRLVGYLRTGPLLARFADRIERLPFLPWPDLFASLGEVDVNLAPLAGREPFDDAKSEVKYLEAAVLGVPTIASPTSAFRHAIEDGRNGLLAAGENEWEEKILRLVDDAGLRRRLGNAALADAFLHYTPAAQADELVAALDAFASTAPGVSPGDGETADAAALRTRHPGEVGRYDLEPADAVTGPAVTARDSPSPFLLPGRAVGQTIRCAHDNLYRIDVCVGTDGHANDHRLVVHLAECAEPGAPDLRAVTLDAAAFADHAWIAAEFEPIPDSAGRTFYLWVESEGAAPGNAVTLWTYVEGWGEELPQGLHLDHQPAPGSLTFRAFSRPGHRSA
jgi:glycosyltransferase involved in cell wall biosynthesis